MSFSQVTSVEKRKSRKHFSASAYGLGLKKLFLGFLFSTFVTWEKLKSDVEKFYFRRDMEKIKTKYYYSKGAFNNHVDKKGWVGGLKFAIFVHVY